MGWVAFFTSSVDSRGEWHKSQSHSQCSLLLLSGSTLSPGQPGTETIEALIFGSNFWLYILALSFGTPGGFGNQALWHLGSSCGWRRTWWGRLPLPLEWCRTWWCRCSWGCTPPSPNHLWQRSEDAWAITCITICDSVFLKQFLEGSRVGANFECSCQIRWRLLWGDTLYKVTSNYKLQNWLLGQPIENMIFPHIWS